MPKTCRTENIKSVSTTPTNSTRRHRKRSENDMQDDAFKEGNTANVAIIRLPTKEQAKLSHVTPNGRRPKQHL
jgi:hypothetical protein